MLKGEDNITTVEEDVGIEPAKQIEDQNSYETNGGQEPAAEAREKRLPRGIRNCRF